MWSGSENTGSSVPPADTVAGVPGGFFDCVLSNIGAVRCWGSSHYFWVRSQASLTPLHTKSVNLAAKAAVVSVGESHACAALVGGGLQCWGDGTDGKLGYGDNVSAEQPRAKPVLLRGQEVIDVAAGFAQMRGNTVATGGDSKLGRTHWIRMTLAARVADGGDVIDVDAEAKRRRFHLAIHPFRFRHRRLRP